MGSNICPSVQQDCGCFYLQLLEGVERAVTLNVQLQRRIPWLKIDPQNISSTRANSLRLSYHQFKNQQHQDIGVKNLISLLRKIYPQENYVEAINQIQRQYPIIVPLRQRQIFLRKQLFSDSILSKVLIYFPLIYEESKLLAYIRLPLKDTDQLIRSKYVNIKKELKQSKYQLCMILEFPETFLANFRENSYLITKSFIKGYALLGKNEQEKQLKQQKIKESMDRTNRNLYFVRIMYKKAFLSDDFDPGFMGDKQSIFQSFEVLFNKNHIFQISSFNRHLQQREITVWYGIQSATFKKFLEGRYSRLQLRQRYLVKNSLFIQDSKKQSQIQILQNRNDISKSIISIQTNLSNIEDQEKKNKKLLQVARKQRQLGNYQRAVIKYNQITQESRFKQIANLQSGQILFSERDPNAENIINNLNLQRLNLVNQRFYLKGKLLKASLFLRRNNLPEVSKLINQVLNELGDQDQAQNQTNLTRFDTENIDIRLETLFLKAKYFMSRRNYNQAQSILLQVKYEKLCHHGKSIQLTIIQETLQQLYRLSNQQDKLNRQALYLTQIRQQNVNQRQQQAFIRNTNIYHTI